MADELSVKTRQRNAIRRNAKKEIDTAQTIFEPDTVLDLHQAQTLANNLTDYRNRITKLDTDILLHIEDETQADNECDTAADFDAVILQTISAINAKIQQVNSAPVSEHIRASHSTNSINEYRSTNSIHEHRGPSVKLPKLEISKFYGDPLHWAEFWDSYTSTIHDNDDLSDVDKFKYLRSLLGGDALTVIDGYMLTSANYATAVEALTNTYGNKELAIFAHLETMLSLSSANHDVKQLQQIYNECEKHIRSLVALGMPEETFGRVFTPIILSKLPTYVKMEMYRKNGSGAWELSKLREWLREEIRARDYSQRVFGNGSKNDQSSGQKSNDRKNNPKKSSSGPQGTSSALVTNEKQSNPPRCSLCSEAHFADQCQKYPDAESRKQRIIETRRCFKCLSDKHAIKSCQSSRACVHCGKTGHHRSLCLKKFKSKKSSSTDQSTSLNVENDSVAQQTIHKTAQLVAHGEKALLQTALAKIQNKDGSTSTARILFDTGCTRSFITTKLGTKIKSRQQPDEVVSIAGFADTVRKTVKYKTIEFDVLTPNGGSKTMTANMTSTISCPIQKHPLDVKAHPVICQLQLAEPISSSPEMVDIDILLGTDYYYDFVGTEQIRLSNGVIFLSSVLGFIATGKMKCDSSESRKGSALFISGTQSFPESTFHVEKFWSLEDIGVKDSVSATVDDEAMKSFNDSIEFVDGRYHVDWPWKQDEKELPDNYGLALGRLKSLKKRFDTSPEVLAQYGKTIQDQFSKGVIEEVPKIDTDNKIHYIPHHCVITPNKTTTKLRIVYDASAKCSKQSVSLNECLHRGPVLLDDLCGLLLRFRLAPIAIVSDIEKAFLQVGLHDRARDVTRFLWLRDPSAPVSKDNLIEYRFCRVPFGFKSSPFLLGATVRHHIDRTEKPVAKELDGSIYVDNVFGGRSSLSDAKSYYVNTKELFNDASMNLREWFTNDPELREVFAESDKGKGDVTKVLGLNWNTVDDTLGTNSLNVQVKSVTTKRQMLSNLAKVFDPCGYFAAVTVAGKILIQKLWKDQYAWDDNLPNDVVEEWKQCASSLKQISKFELPRCILSKPVGDYTSFTLHCFVDASAKAYGACVYLVYQDKSSVGSSLIFAKSRISPLHGMTIPKLELMAMLIGVRVTSFVAEQLKLAIQRTIVWSDSQCVLHWLSKATLEGKFVKNRIEEIKKHQDFHFRYVPTAQNPADLASRGCSYDDIVSSKLWWHGPVWLTESEEVWPNVVHKTVSVDLEEKADVLVVEDNDVAKSQSNVVPLIDIGRFSTLLRLLRVTAWIFRVVNWFKSSQKADVAKGPLTSDELSEARKYWETTTQMTEFEETINCLRSNTVDKRYKQLSLFMDNDNLIRCGGRLDNADLPPDTKWPILLPKNSQFTDLVIGEIHAKLYHSGATQTLSSIRSRYWIIHGRSQVKKFIFKCLRCRCLYGGPFKYPRPPPLPKCRVTPQRPFECIGVDYLGPLYVKESHHTAAGSSTNKVWICLFTCTAIRAVHLDLVMDLSVHQFLLCLRRFVALYWAPRIIISDNGKQFTATDRFLSKMTSSSEVQDYSSSHGISWEFITERSPWMGGFYERLVGIVKKALKSSLDRRCVSTTELQTVIADVCSVVNSRPITSVGSDVDAVPLTPSHFLKGHCLWGSFLPDGTQKAVSKSTDYNSLTGMWKRIQNTTDAFWNTWKTQYLLALRNSFHFRDRNTSNIQPSIGAVVIVKDNLPRNQWRLGRITSLRPSKDGQIRTALVRLPNGNTIARALRLLFPLEVSPTTEVTQDTATGSQQNDQDNMSQTSIELLAL